MFAHYNRDATQQEVIKMARNKVCTKTTNDDGSISFVFADKEVMKVSPGDFSDAIQSRLMSHGLSQKLGDSFAGVQSPVEARARVAQVIEGLTTENWTTRTPGEPRTNMLIEALAEIQKVEVDVMRKFVEGLDDETKKSVRSHPEVKAKMSEIRAKKDAAAVAKADVAPLADMFKPAK